MNIAYLDLVGGLSGDMFLAALLDVGLPEGDLRKLLAALPGGLDLRTEEAFQCGLRGRRVIVLCSQPGALPATRDELLSLVKGLRLPKNLVEKLLALLEELFRAEAKVHGLSPEAVHLHELSSYDTLADLVGVLWGLEELGVSELFSSAVPLGRGLIKGAHGPLPLPAPAVLELLHGVPIEGFPEEGETVTPTGALLLKSLVRGFGPLPSMRLKAVGTGVGQREWKTRPNVVRFFWGEVAAKGLPEEVIYELVTDMDDETPESIAGACEKLRAKGALDVSLTPLYMKKGRFGVRLTVLARPEDVSSLKEAIFRETSTLGIRVRKVRRFVRPRRIIEIETPLGPVRVKVSEGPGKVFKPEWADIESLSARWGKSLNETKQIVWKAILRSLLD